MPSANVPYRDGISGTCPVMERITVDGKIAQFSLKEDFRPDYWDAQKGRANGKTREQIALNRKIDQTEQRAEIKAQLSLNRHCFEGVGF